MDEGTKTLVYEGRIELPRLEVVAGSERAVLADAPVVVGSHEDCDLVLADPRASRRHCRLTLGPKGVLVEDLGSKNGTRIGGLEVERAYVGALVPIMVGDTKVIVSPLGETESVALSPTVRFGDALGGSVAMRALFAKLERAASGDLTVLLLGESGTGKDVLARGMHALSARRDGPFVPFDCSAVPSQLMEAELFGHVRGAFTGAHSDRRGVLGDADGGTLFVDEIGELPLDLQPKLLRALESREYRPVGGSGYEKFDARILAATHRTLRRAVADRTFREDLYYRLAVVEARVPPLRERKDDIELLVDHFLTTSDPPRSIRDLPSGTLTMLLAHEWPGNVRELKNAVARLLLFPESGAAVLSSADAPAGATLPLHLPLRQAREEVVERFERAYVVAKLAEARGNVSRAADAMGVSRQLVHRLMERYDVRRSDVP
jgi:transcriptional regulator with PAS, ATPase and Fis domain